MGKSKTIKVLRFVAQLFGIGIVLGFILLHLHTYYLAMFKTTTGAILLRVNDYGEGWIEFIMLIYGFFYALWELWLGKEKW